MNGLLEDELCPDEIERWHSQKAPYGVFGWFGNNRIKGLILGADGDMLVGKDAQKPPSRRVSVLW